MFKYEPQMMPNLKSINYSCPLGCLKSYQSAVSADLCSQCYKTFFGGNLENLDFPLS